VGQQILGRLKYVIAHRRLYQLIATVSTLLRDSDRRVDFVDNRLDPGTGTVRARVVLKNWNPNLITPGFFIRVRVAGATPYRAALVADNVISSQQGVKYAFVVKPDNTIERRTLETASTFEGKRIVKSGLKDGEKVVSTRLQLLQPGMKVTPVPEK